MSICPVCRAGNLLSLGDRHDITVNGYTTTVPVFYSVCQSCGEEMILPEQIQQNDEYLRRARRVLISYGFENLGGDIPEQGGPYMTEEELQQWNQEITNV
jgi:hypothetical protein